MDLLCKAQEVCDNGIQKLQYSHNLSHDLPEVEAIRGQG